MRVSLSVGLVVVVSGCGPQQTATASFSSEGETPVAVQELGVVGRTGELRVVEEVGAAHLTADATLVWRGDFVPTAQFGVDGTKVALSDTCPKTSFSCEVDWEVRTPAVEVSHQVGSGNVTLIGGLGPVRLDVGTGTVTAEGVVDRLNVDVGTGGITATALDVSSVQVATGTGDVTVEVDHDGTVDAGVAVGTGDVRLDLAGDVLGARVRVGTGDVTLTLPAGAYNFVLTTTGTDPVLPAGLVQDAGGGNVEVEVGAGEITLLVR